MIHYDFGRRIARLTPAQRKEFNARLRKPCRTALKAQWESWAHKGQMPPAGNWRIWLILAGRGYGKTRAGAEWVRSIAESDGSARIALVGTNFAEARSVMVEGPSGLLRIAPARTRPIFEPSLRRLIWPNGAEAHLFSACEPEALRGPEHSHAWCDEVAKWESSGAHAETTWQNLNMGLRLGKHPRIVVTTTPRAVALVRRLHAQSRVVRSDMRLTGGRTRHNLTLPSAFINAMNRDYAGTLLARQELDGELIEDIDGALWTRTLLERCRATGEPPALRRIVIGVDPPASAVGDACGIVVAALDTGGNGHVLADASVERASPERWARAVANAAEAWQADRVVAEANQGGAMVKSVLHAADIRLPVKMVHATRGKVARAEPVAALYESGRIVHRGNFAALEDELCGLMPGGTYEGPGRSPDRADALVWALTELMLGRKGEPGVRTP